MVEEAYAIPIYTVLYTYCVNIMCHLAWVDSHHTLYQCIKYLLAEVNGRKWIMAQKGHSSVAQNT